MSKKISCISRWFTSYLLQEIRCALLVRNVVGNTPPRPITTTSEYRTKPVSFEASQSFVIPPPTKCSDFAQRPLLSFSPSSDLFSKVSLSALSCLPVSFSECPLNPNQSRGKKSTSPAKYTFNISNNHKPTTNRKPRHRYLVWFRVPLFSGTKLGSKSSAAGRRWTILLSGLVVCFSICRFHSAISHFLHELSHSQQQFVPISTMPGSLVSSPVSPPKAHLLPSNDGVSSLFC